MKIFVVLLFKICFSIEFIKSSTDSRKYNLFHLENELEVLIIED
jgi:hypothetical protein